MVTERNEFENAALTDKDLEGVVGGKADWDELIRFIRKMNPNSPDIGDLASAVKAEDWEEAVTITSRLLKLDPVKYAPVAKYLK